MQNITKNHTTEQKQQIVVERKIGGTGIGTILGLNPYESEIDLYMTLLKLTEPKTANEAMYWGSAIQREIMKRYNKETGRDMVFLGDTVFRHPKYEWFTVSPDAAENPTINDDGTYSCEHGLEMKETTLRHEYGAPGTDEAPERVILQCQWAMEASGAKTYDIAVRFLTRPQEFAIYHLQRDDELIAMAISKAEDFYYNHVVPQIPPPVDSSPGWDKYFKAKYPQEEDDSIELSIDSDFNLNVDALKRWTIALKNAEYHKTHYENTIKGIIGNHNGLVSPIGKITWKKSKDRQTIDWQEAFRELHNLWKVEANSMQGPPYMELFLKDYTTVKPGPRIFRATFNKENE